MARPSPDYICRTKSDLNILEIITLTSGRLFVHDPLELSTRVVELTGRNTANMNVAIIPLMAQEIVLASLSPDMVESLRKAHLIKPLNKRSSTTNGLGEEGVSAEFAVEDWLAANVKQYGVNHTIDASKYKGRGGKEI